MRYIGNRQIDLIGQRFGRYIVLKRASKFPSHDIYWLCRCDCGNLRTVRGSSLRSNESKSCGCLAAELTIQRNKKLTKNIVVNSVFRRYKYWAKHRKYEWRLDKKDVMLKRI